jgi:aspartate dehydrogenase
MLGIGPPVGRPLRMGLWGCGKVGGQIAEGLQAGQGGNVQVVGVLARSASERLTETAASLGAQACTSPEALLELRPEVVVEAATAQALAELGPGMVEAGVTLVALSPVCLVEPEVQARFRAAAEAGGGCLLLPPGSADGIEFLRAIRTDELRSVRLRVFWKPTPQHPYTGSGQPQEIFAGTAREAAQRFPLTTNFVVALSLAGLGPQATKVHVLLDPNAENTHYELEAIAAGGELRAAVQLRRPSGQSGRLAALSGLEAIRQLAAGRVAPL